MARCEAIKKNGEQCKGKAKEGSLFCRVHAHLAEELVESKTPPAPLDEAAPSVGDPQTDEERKERKDERMEDRKPSSKLRLGGKESDMVAILNKGKMRRVRYVGKGRYIIASLGINLGPDDYGKEIDVDHKFWERMHTNSEAMSSFEEV